MIKLDKVDSSQYLRLEDAAALLGVKKSTFYIWRKYLPDFPQVVAHSKGGYRKPVYYYSVAELEKFRKNHPELLNQKSF